MKKFLICELFLPLCFQVDSDIEDEADVVNLLAGNEKVIEGVFKNIDANGDGRVTYEEFDAAESGKWNRSKISNISSSILLVIHNLLRGLWIKVYEILSQNSKVCSRYKSNYLLSVLAMGIVLLDIGENFV